MKKNKKETTYDECGVCVKCGNEDLKYDEVVVETGYMFYPYICSKCGHQGEENYEINWIYQS